MVISIHYHSQKTCLVNRHHFYGLTKLTAEGYLRIYEQAFGLKTVCFRYANVYGPRQGMVEKAV